ECLELHERPHALPAKLRRHSIISSARARSEDGTSRPSIKRCIPSRNELAPSSLSFWTFSLVSRPMPSPDQSDDDPNDEPESVRAKSKDRADHHVIAGQR